MDQLLLLLAKGLRVKGEGIEGDYQLDGDISGQLGKGELKFTGKYKIGSYEIELGVKE